MNDPTSVSSSVVNNSPAAESSILGGLMSNKVIFLLLFCFAILGMQFWTNKKEKEEAAKLKQDLENGKVIKLNDGTVGVIIEIDQSSQTIIIDSAGTRLCKTIECVASIY
jgi:preprotein translocase subunit YajC